jgi:predicted nucleic acid-binding protein
MVFDSYAILALLQSEPGAGDQVEEILAEAGESQRFFMSAINAGEVWYIVARAKSTAAADQAIAIIDRLGIDVKPVDWELTSQAAKFKARLKMSYADCFAAALAHKLHGAVVSGDPEFAEVEAEVPIRWLKRKGKLGAG